MRNALIIILGLLSCACSSTKFTYFSAPPRLLTSEVIMMKPVEGIPPMISYDLFLSGAKLLSTDSNSVMYLPEKEYDLLKGGIEKELLYDSKFIDTAKVIMNNALGVEYIMEVKIVGVKNKGASYNYYTANELNRYQSPYNQNESSSEAALLFTFYYTGSSTDPSQFSVAADIGPLVINDADGGESRVNLSDSRSAIILAFEKAVKRVRKDMVTYRDR